MTLKEFKKQTAHLSDDTILLLYDGEYGNTFELSKVVFSPPNKEDASYFGFWGTHPENTKEYEEATKNKIVLI